jgi:hypothetical protein
VLESKPIDRTPKRTFVQFIDFMFAPFFMDFMFSLLVERLNIPHQAGSLSSSFRVILAAERKIIRLVE